MFGICVSNGHSETTSVHVDHSFTYYSDLTQTLTTVALGGNHIEDDGVRYIASSLSINKVGEPYAFQSLIKFVVLHRQSRHYT